MAGDDTNGESTSKQEGIKKKIFDAFANLFLSLGDKTLLA